MKSVVVTGVSSGIGEGLAKELDGRGYRVFGRVCREEDAGGLAAELGANFRPSSSTSPTPRPCSGLPKR